MPNYNGSPIPDKEFSVNSDGSKSDSFDINENQVIDEANESEHEAMEAHEQNVVEFLKELNDDESVLQPGLKTIESQQARTLYKGKTLRDYDFPQDKRLSQGRLNSQGKAKFGAETTTNFKQERKEIFMAINDAERATPEPKIALMSGGGPRLASSGKKRIKKNFHAT